MTPNPLARVLALVLPFAVFVAAIVPSSASARPGPEPEPVFVLSGFNPDCNLPARPRNVGGLPAIVTKQEVGGIRTDAAERWGVQPIPSDWLVEFTIADGYTNCTSSVVTIGRRLENLIRRKIAEWNSALPAGYAPVTKVDVVGNSFGSTVARSCIANAGRGNPANETPGCAALIDDWVGLVPPSHGTKTPWIIGCPLVFPSVCNATTPGGDLLRKLNERYNGDPLDGAEGGDETPQVPGTTPIEYTTLWAGADGLISPVASAGLWGAANFRIEAGAETATTHPRQLNHLNASDNGICKGSPDFGTSGTWEWIAWMLLDAGEHRPTREESPRGFPTPSAPYGVLNCKTGPPGLTPNPNPN